MKSHRTIWTIAAIAVFIALIALAFRRSPERPASYLDDEEDLRATGVAMDERDRLAEEMIALLEKDPRVRRPATQRTVESVAAYALQPALATSETFYALGLRKYYGERRFEDAEEAFLMAIDMDPRWSWPRNGLGIVLFDTGREEQGLASFHEALRLDPDWSRPHSDMAILYRDSERMDEAIREVEAALEIEPLHPVNHYNYGVILDQLERHPEARARYETALELSPGLPQALYNLACSYAREGDLKTALPFWIESILLDEAFREEAAFDPDFDPVRDEADFVSVFEGENG